MTLIIKMEHDNLVSKEKGEINQKKVKINVKI